MQVQVILGGADAQTAAGGAADLDGFKASALDAAADVEDDLAQGGSHGNLDQAGVVHVSGEGDGLGAVVVLRAHGFVPVRTL